MLNQKNVGLGKVRSCIRELFEYGKRRKAEIGEDKVFDFSIGNPNVPAPKELTDTLRNLLENTDPVALHGYTSAQGDANTRNSLAEFMNKKYGTSLDADCFYLTCGASASLAIVFGAILTPGEEVVTFAPFFPEYRVFVEHAGGKLVPVLSDLKTFRPNFELLEKSLNENTKAVLINSPNNPSGVVLGKEEIERISEILKEHEKRTGKEIYLISDEPYREIVYGKEPPCVFSFYERSFICYSYSKCLSLAGDRIGYIAVNNKMREFGDAYAAVCGAGRSLGYVCAPSLFQKLVGKVTGMTADIGIYKKNRDTLLKALRSYGFEVVEPDGAFYLFVKALEPDAKVFAERAKKFELLIVPSDDFGVEGYVRVSYCVAPDMIERALPAFKKLAESYGKGALK